METTEAQRSCLNLETDFRLTDRSHKVVNSKESAATLDLDSLCENIQYIQVSRPFSHRARPRFKTHLPCTVDKANNKVRMKHYRFPLAVGKPGDPGTASSNDGVTLRWIW